MRFTLAMTVITLIMCSLSLAGEPADLISSSPLQELISFIDLDGDGINDNLTDSNNDGIPDQPEPIAPTSGIFSGNKAFAAPATALAPSNSDSFNQRLSRVTCLSMNRGGFGAGENFGPADGLGIGAGTGGGCVGGICH